MQLEVVSGPAVPLVTLDEAKKFARVWLDLTDDDELLTSLIASAIGAIEHSTARAFINRTLKDTRFKIPESRRVRLQRAPVSAIVGVTIDGVEIDADAYELKPGTPGWLVLRSGAGSEIAITYVAGYGAAAADVPDRAKLVVKMLVAHWYARREPIITGTIVAEVPFAVEAISNTLRWGGEIPR